MFRRNSYSKQRARYLIALVLVSIVSSFHVGLAPASAQTTAWGYAWHDGKCYKTNRYWWIAKDEMKHGNLTFWHVTALSFTECVKAGPSPVSPR